MAKLWHPMFRELSIERDEADVAAYVAAGWLKNKSTRKALKAKSDESSTKTVSTVDEPEKAETTSPATDED